MAPCVRRRSRTPRIQRRRTVRLFVPVAELGRMVVRGLLRRLVELGVGGAHLGVGGAGEQEGAAHLAGETQSRVRRRTAGGSDRVLWRSRRFAAVWPRRRAGSWCQKPVEAVRVGDRGVEEAVALFVGGGGVDESLDDRARAARVPAVRAPWTTERMVRLWERASTKPARWAASWTESMKTSAFFSRRSRPGVPNRLVSETDSSVASRVPRKRMASFSPQAGQALVDGALVRVEACVDEDAEGDVRVGVVLGGSVEVEGCGVEVEVAAAGRPRQLAWSACFAGGGDVEDEGAEASVASRRRPGGSVSGRRSRSSPTARVVAPHPERPQWRQ